MTTPEPRPVIWTQLSGQGRGPARTLDFQMITRAAIELADEEGLDAVSMRKIASRMDHSAMALYRHVGSKEDLSELMYDAVLGEMELADRPSGDWRIELAELARGFRLLHHRHSWISRLGQRPTLGPNFLRLMEYALAAVDNIGLDIDEMLDLVSTTLQFTRGLVQEELAGAEAQQRTGMDEEAWRRHLTPLVTQVVSSDDNPYVKRLILEAEDFPDPDAIFERRLSMVLDGLAASLK